jgi:hypothetical protein
MSRRYSILVVGSLAVAAFISLSGIAQTKTKEPPWVAKDWTQWTSLDCDSVLNGSPWVDYESVGGGDAPLLSRRIQLRSSLPIQQALVRQIQVDKNYDKMNAKQKEKFDLQHGLDLDSMSESVLVDITNISRWSPSADTTPFYFDSPPEAPRQAALKFSNGSIVEPTQTKILKNQEFDNECQYVFPRNVNGKPVMSASDPVLEIVLGGPLIFDPKTKQIDQMAFQQLPGAYSIKDDKTGKVVGEWFFQIYKPVRPFKISDQMDDLLDPIC